MNDSQTIWEKSMGEAADEEGLFDQLSSDHMKTLETARSNQKHDIEQVHVYRVIPLTELAIRDNLLG